MNFNKKNIYTFYSYFSFINKKIKFKFIFLCRQNIKKSFYLKIKINFNYNKIFLFIRQLI